MTVGSLFSGIGGIDLGLERAGMEIRWQVEIDPFARRVLEKHWPHVTRYGDIQELTGDELEPVDLICGGFPCQPVSLAGRRRGEDDTRWLWPEFARIVRHLRPRYVLVENVPGLLVRGMGRVLGDLAELGYDAEWASIPAAAFGAPHLRYRVFIVAYATGLGARSVSVWPGRPLEAQAHAARDGAAASNAPSEQAGLTGQPRLDRSVESMAADSDRQRCDGWPRIFPTTWPPGGDAAQRDNPWAVEPDVGRVAHGVPHRVDRLRALGNAVVPQVAEWIGRRILAFDAMFANARLEAAA